LKEGCLPGLYFRGKNTVQLGIKNAMLLMYKQGKWKLSGKRPLPQTANLLKKPLEKLPARGLLIQDSGINYQTNF
jgi:hypothetical protein